MAFQSRAAVCAAVAISVLTLVIVATHHSSQPDERLDDADVSAVQVSEHEANQQDREADRYIKEINAMDARDRAKKRAAALARMEKAAAVEVDKDLKMMRTQAKQAKKDIKPAVKKVRSATTVAALHLAEAENEVKAAHAQVKLASAAADMVQQHIASENKKAAAEHSSAKEQMEQAGMYRRTAAVLQSKSAQLASRAKALSAKLDALKLKEKARKHQAEHFVVVSNEAAAKEKIAKANLKAEESRLAHMRAEHKAEMKRVLSLDHAVSDLQKMAGSKKADRNYSKANLVEAQDAIAAAKVRVQVKEREAYYHDVQQDPLYREV